MFDATINVSFIIIFIFCGLVVYSLRSTTVQNTTLTIQCAPGQCALNLETGEKRCSDTGSVQAYPKYEICSDPYICNIRPNIYPMSSDSGTIDASICPGNFRCKCVNSKTCPHYILSRFLVGDEYIEQKEDSGLCEIESSQIIRSIPGCRTTSNIFTAPDLKVCMAGGTACLAGALALIPDSVTSFLEASDPLVFPLGCVPGIPCPANLFSVWDKKTNTIVCVDK